MKTILAIVFAITLVIAYSEARADLGSGMPVKPPGITPPEKVPGLSPSGKPPGQSNSPGQSNPPGVPNPGQVMGR